MTELVCHYDGGHSDIIILDKIQEALSLLGMNFSSLPTSYTVCLLVHSLK